MINKILRISFFNFITKLFTSLLVLLTQFVISRYYLMDDLGTYSKLFNYINIATVAGGLGLNVSAIFYLRKNLLPESSVILYSYTAFFLFSGIIFGVMFAIGASVPTAAIIALFALCNNLFFLHNAIAQSAMNYVRFNLQNLLYSGISLAAIGLIIFTKGSIPVEHILAVQLIYLFLLIVLFFRRSWFGSKENNPLVRAPASAFIKYGSRIFVTNVLGIILYSGDIILLNYFFSDEALAVYLVSATAIKLLWLGIDSVGLVIYPELIQSAKEEKTPMLGNLNKMFAIVSGMLAASLLVFIFFGQWLVGLFYGEGFEQMYQIIILLIIATQGVLFYKFLSRFFAATQNWWPIYISLVTGIIINWLMIWFFVPVAGVIGAAYASVGAYLATGIIIGAWYFIGVKKYKIEAV